MDPLFAIAGSVIVGAVGSLLAAIMFPSVNIGLHKIRVKMGLGAWNKIIKDKTGKSIFNNIICLDVTERRFSEIAMQYLEERRRLKTILITNIREPFWFYWEFKRWVDAVGACEGHTQVSEWLIEYEAVFEGDFDAACRFMDLICHRFYATEEVGVFPHLRAFNRIGTEIGGIEKARINFFDLNIACRESVEKFKRRNRKLEVYFFDRVINYNTASYCYPRMENGGYRGTDALILNNRVILNYDDSIQELNYQENDLIGVVKNGFFWYVINRFDRHRKDFVLSSRILELY